MWEREKGGHLERLQLTNGVVNLVYIDACFMCMYAYNMWYAW